MFAAIMTGLLLETISIYNVLLGTMLRIAAAISCYFDVKRLLRKEDGNPFDTEEGFSIREKEFYFKKKWRKEHIALLVVLFVIVIGAAVLPFVFNRIEFICISPMIALLEYGYQNNKMMFYVEHQLYD